MSDAYRDALNFLYDRLNYERTGMPRIPSELRLGRMRRLLRKLGDPQDACPIVHVAGTKGKGSTSAMIASALTASGVSTGLFCSPHLHRLEERFRVDGREASSEDLVALVDAVRPAVAAFDSSLTHHRHRGPTFFEVTTAMGLLHFARRGTGAVVLEVGMGGRLDSTNCVRPRVSVITSISYDHTKQLGATLAAIATEKAGILKRGRPAVIGVQGQEARDAIRRIAHLRSSHLREIDRDFSYTCEPPAQPILRPTSVTARVSSWAKDWGPLDVPLLGPHQAHNAAVALATLDVLGEQGISVSEDDVRRGWSTLKWPARVEVVGESPWLVIDGAHNVASACALAETLRVCLPDVPRTMIFGSSREKDYVGQLRELLPMFDRVVVSRYLENPRAVPTDEIVAAIRELSGGVGVVEVAETPAEAIERARRGTPAAGLICVTGSLFLAAEIRALVL